MKPECTGRFQKIMINRKKDKWYDEAEKWRYDRLCKLQKAEKSTLTSM